MPKRSLGKLVASYVLLCCSVLLACAGCEKSPDSGTSKSEFEIDKNFERGPLTVHVRADKATITIAETLLLELEAAVEPGFEVTMPKIDKVLESFDMVDWNSLGDKLDENGNVVSTYQYRLEPLLSGTYSIPAFTFEFHDVNSPEEKKYELTTEPIDIEVTSLLDDQRGELKIEDIEDVVEIPAEPSFWWAWVLGVIAATAAAGTWLWLRRRRVKELVRIFKPAHELAYERLRILVNEDLVGAGRVKEFYERISDILRHYIEHRFTLRAPERTTEEFLYELANTNVLPESDKESLAQFLEHCDLVKFARYEPTTEQIQETFNLVKAFIEKTKSDERKVDVTEMVVSEETAEIGSA
ncbi:MAG: hypothetical protein JSW47_15690 [Phycisphaerales bacterium]|nr:MAG: hypothetical protein JSW47_15690 [Phycisphaerales bacterium]